MMKKYCVGILFLFVVLVCSGAQAQEPKEVPFDVQFAVAVATAEIMHRPPDPSVATVSNQAAEALGGDPFNYKGFGLSSTVLRSYEQGAGGEESRKLKAMLQFSDSNQRRTLAAVNLDYQINGNNFSLDHAAMGVIAPPNPRVVVHFVPAATLKTAGKDVYKDWNALYSFAVANSVKPVQSSERAQYYGFIFCMDRTASDAKLYPVVSRRKTEKNKKKAIAKTETLDYGGWKVAVVSGRLQLGNAGKKFYMNIFYKPGSFAPADRRDTRRIAQYNSGDQSLTTSAPSPKKPASQLTLAPVSGQAVQPQQAAPAPVVAPVLQQTAPAPVVAPAQPPAPAPVVPSAAQSAPAQAEEGPLALGRSFLNPVFPDDVELIQVRLKDLGYYRGPVDKNFGPQTKRALNNYAVKFGFPKGQWSLGLQKTMFKGTGL